MKDFNKNRIGFLILFFIVAIGAYLRVSGIFTNSFAFTYDVGRDMLAIRDIVVNHKIPLIGQTTGLEGLFYGPWWYYILTIPFLVSVGNPQFIAFFIAIVNIGAIILAYILGKKISGTFLGLVFSSLISFSPFFIGVSVQIWNPNLIPFFVLIILLLLSKVFSKTTRSSFIFFGIGIILALIMDFEFVFGAIFAFSTMFFLLLFERRSISKKDYILFVLGVFLINIPRFVFELRHNFLMTNSVINAFINFHKENISVSLKIGEKLQIFSDIFNHTLETKELSIVVFIGILIVYFFLYNKQKAEEKKFSVFALFTLAIFIISSFFISRAIWVYYFMGIPIFYLLLISIGLCLLQRASNKYYSGPLILVFIFIIVFKPMDFIKSEQRLLFEGDAAVYRNQLAVIDYVYKQANGSKFNYIVYTPPVHGYTYKYLFLWHGDKIYHYQPSEEKQNLFYVIMEPDFQNPQRLTDWLKVREGDGKIIGENIVKGGIKVQLRLH